MCNEGIIIEERDCFSSYRKKIKGNKNFRHCNAVTDDRGGVSVDKSKNKPFWVHIRPPEVWKPR